MTVIEHALTPAITPHESRRAIATPDAPAPVAPPATANTVIEPPRGWQLVNVRELWDYRELLYFLTWRDVKVKYKQTVIGAGWAILQPFLTMVVFTLVFKNIANISSEGIPYPIFTYTALLPWNLFAGALSRSTVSLVSQVGLVSKVYFPRLIMPLSATFSGIVDFAIAFVILLGMMFWYGITPTLAILDRKSVV